LSVNFVSSFPPRECGIATFTNDLTANLSNISENVVWNVSVVQECKKLFLSNTSLRVQAAQLGKREFVRSKRFASKTFNVIKDCNVESFIAAAKLVNNSKIDVVNIQHEFGLYKGDFGCYILAFMRRVRKPIVTTFHTVLPNPPEGMREVVKDIFALSDKVIVSANAGIELLRNKFGLDKARLIMVPHGVPQVPTLVDTEFAKRGLGLAGKFVIASYGLINPDKGIEFVIQALPSIIEANPHEDIIYLIVGEHHPALDKRVRELYRGKISGLVKELGLTRNVRFIERYLSNKDMIRYFLATDVCAITNMNPDQISSGVLSQAIGCGRSIIATKFAHAAEALSNGRGLFVEFGNPEDMAEKSNLLVADPELRKTLSHRVHVYGRSLTWDKIARRYFNIFAQVQEPQALPAPIPLQQRLSEPMDRVLQRSKA
jgi:glycosyltransferase involved in cell wall biosynthesis